jgi:hypothetical protein
MCLSGTYGFISDLNLLASRGTGRTPEKIKEAQLKESGVYVLKTNPADGFLDCMPMGVR